MADLVSRIYDVLPEECLVLRQRPIGTDFISCTALIGGKLPNGGEWTEEMCCLPCRIRMVLTDQGPQGVRATPEPEWMRKATLTVPEAGEILGLGRDAAYEAVRSGQIPCIPIGRRKVVPVARLKAMLGYEV